MLSLEEFERLQKLSAISLNNEEQKKLSDQMSTIIDFLSKLQSLPLNSQDKKIIHMLSPISWVSSYKDNKQLFQNVSHEKVWNSIMINSVVDN